jgi:hypothetical protein
MRSQRRLSITRDIALPSNRIGGDEVIGHRSLICTWVGMGSPNYPKTGGRKAQGGGRGLCDLVQFSGNRLVFLPYPTLADSL